MKKMTKIYRVLISCSDEKGLVYKISGVFYNYNLSVDSNNEFVDHQNNKFFMRSVVEGEIDVDSLSKELHNVLPSDADIKIIEPKKKNIVLLATKESHALGDILIRYEAGELDANIIGVISNYDSLQSLVEKFNINYYHISHEDIDRQKHEELIIEQIEALGDIDYLILAKYMRILTPKFVEAFENKIINIHHSFLPAFIGANPYKQAFNRGVKTIGATAHFVNNDLDEGPIIEQDVIAVNHAQSWQQMRMSGRDVEKIVLSRALKLALEDRIFVYENKTIIF